MPQYTRMDAHPCTPMHMQIHQARGSEENVMKLVLSFHLYVAPGINPSSLSGYKCQIPVMV